MHAFYVFAYRIAAASPQCEICDQRPSIVFSSISSKWIKYMPIYCFYTTLGGIGRYREIRRLFARSCMLYHI